MMDYKQQLPKNGHSERNMFKRVPLTLIDFGFATKYVEHEIDAEGNKKLAHKPKDVVAVFRGNMLFSSVNQLKFKTTSRRDDLISLCYMLIFLLNGGELPGLSASYAQTL